TGEGGKRGNGFLDGLGDEGFLVVRQEGNAQPRLLGRRARLSRLQFCRPQCGRRVPTFRWGTSEKKKVKDTAASVQYGGAEERSLFTTTVSAARSLFKGPICVDQDRRAGPGS